MKIKLSSGKTLTAKHSYWCQYFGYVAIIGIKEHDAIDANTNLGTDRFKRAEDGTYSGRIYPKELTSVEISSEEFCRE